MIGYSTTLRENMNEIKHQKTVGHRDRSLVPERGETLKWGFTQWARPHRLDPTVLALEVYI